MTAAFSSPRQNILWLEDDQRLVEIFQDELEERFELTILNSMSVLKSYSPEDLEKFDCFLIDMELTDGKVGLDLIEHFKQLNHETPILVLSNDESINSRIRALKLGAYDYMWKAMEIEEIILRITNTISRNETKKTQLAGLEILPLRFLAHLHQEEIDLSKIEFQLLNYLIKKHPSPLSIDFLKTHVWRTNVVEIGTINTFIWKLNKKLNHWDFRITKEKEQVFLISKDSNPA